MARFNNGWVKLYRSVMEGDLKDNPYLLALWSWLLAAATWRETKLLDGGKQRTLPAGSVVFGISELAETWKCSKATVSKWAHYLHDTKRISLEVRTSGCIATIRNWDVYQGNEDEVRTPSEHQVNTERTPSEHGVNCIEEVKKIRREESKNIHAPEFDFESLYRKYPRKEGKQGGIKQCEAQIHTQADFEGLSQAIDRYAAHCRKNDQIVKHFSSFLGSKRTGYPWRDWLDPETGSGAAPSSGATALADVSDIFEDAAS